MLKLIVENRSKVNKMTTGLTYYELATVDVRKTNQDYLRLNRLHLIILSSFFFSRI